MLEDWHEWSKKMPCFLKVSSINFKVVGSCFLQLFGEVIPGFLVLATGINHRVYS